ncbi:hypothetical protein TYRP_017726 [Tyrophagus putrescentiae]|nr:hypothetical protein TYRP_017726 [Tyrophagus putrescentiae]
MPVKRRGCCGINHHHCAASTNSYGGSLRWIKNHFGDTIQSIKQIWSKHITSGFFFIIHNIGSRCSINAIFISFC